MRNLSGKEAYRHIERRLLARLQKWQSDTNNPFANTDLLAKYLAETSRVSQQYGGPQSRYRRDDAFRWKYLDYLAPQTSVE